MIFNQICINEEMIPKYIYIYIFLPTPLLRQDKIKCILRALNSEFSFS